MFHELLSLLNDKLVRKMKLNEITSYLLILFLCTDTSGFTSDLEK